MNALYCPLDSSGMLEVVGTAPCRALRMPLWLTLPGGQEFSMTLLLTEVPPRDDAPLDLNGSPVVPGSQNLLHYLGTYWRPEIS